MFASSEPCVSMAGLGAPAVPAVKRRTARSSASVLAYSSFVSTAARSSITTTGTPGNCVRRAPDEVGVRCRSEREQRLYGFEFAGQLVRRRPDIERHGDRAGRERPEVRGDERGLVVGDDRHPITGSRSFGDNGRNSRRPGRELSVGDRIRGRPARRDPARTQLSRGAPRRGSRCGRLRDVRAVSPGPPPMSTNP